VTPRTRTVALGLAALVLVAGAVWWLRPRGVMPLDAPTLEAFQEANSRAMLKLQGKLDGRSFYEVTADGFRRAVADLGYDPDLTLLHWMSPEFRTEAAADPVRSTDLIRLTEAQLRLALADGAPDDEFEQAIRLHNAEVQTAARARRP